MDIDETELWDVANRLADLARPIALEHFRRRDLSAENKLEAGFDPVTVADRAIERAIRDCLAELRPDDAILGEEEAATSGTSGLTWVIDPIDGTRAFVAGTPTWGVLISLNDADGPLLGVIDQPHIGERFLGGLGQAALIGPHATAPLKTRDVAALEDAILLTTFPEVGTVAERRAFEAVADRVKLVRYGLDCYAYGLLAAGHVDLVIEAGLHPYDICAPIAVIEAGGGCVTDWSGGPAHNGGRALAAATPELHSAVLEVLAESGSGVFGEQ